MECITKAFEALDVFELYEILKLRAEVFVVEQNCPYQDVDDLDQFALHNLMYNDDNELVGYTRILPPGARYKEVCISRVVTSPSVRRLGWGKPLMEYTIQKALASFSEPAIRISAQAYLTDFYQSLGFETVGEGYLEDDIPHIEMLRK